MGKAEQRVDPIPEDCEVVYMYLPQKGIVRAIKGSDSHLEDALKSFAQRDKRVFGWKSIVIYCSWAFFVGLFFTLPYFCWGHAKTKKAMEEFLYPITDLQVYGFDMEGELKVYEGLGEGWAVVPMDVRQEVGLKIKWHHDEHSSYLVWSQKVELFMKQAWNHPL